MSVKPFLCLAPDNAPMHRTQHAYTAAAVKVRANGVCLPQGGAPPLPVLFTLFGVATSFISTGLAWQMVR